MPDLERVGTRSDQRPRAFLGRDVAGDDVDARKGALDLLHRVDDVLRVAVRGVDHEDVGAGAHQRSARASRSSPVPIAAADAQAPELVLARVAGTAPPSRCP